MIKVSGCCTLTTVQTVQPVFVGTAVRHWLQSCLKNERVVREKVTAAGDGYTIKTCSSYHLLTFEVP